MLIFADGSSAMPAGGTGVLVIERNDDRVRATVFGSPLPRGCKVTNQRAELLAVQRAAAMVVKPGEAVLWSDSSYAIGTLQPHISGWRPKSNLDIVRPAIATVKQARFANICHVTGHMTEKHKDLPTMYFHDLVDKAAGAAAKTGRETVSVVIDERVHPECLTCALFPCRGRVNYDAPCEKRIAWPMRAVERFDSNVVSRYL